MNIKILRVASNLTQHRLAELLGVSQETISAWETGRTKPRYDMLPKIAEVYGCDISDLFKK